MAALLGLVLGGCSSTPRFVAHDITVSLSPEWQASGNVQSLMVDLVVTSESRSAELAGMPVSRYFAPGQSAGLRAGLVQSGEVMSVRFDGDNTEAKTVRRTDPIWGAWKKAGGDMYVLVNLLQASEAGRKIAIPLTNDQWKGSKIDLVIQRSGIANRSEPKATD